MKVRGMWIVVGLGCLMLSASVATFAGKPGLGPGDKVEMIVTQLKPGCGHPEGCIRIRNNSDQKWVRVSFSSSATMSSSGSCCGTFPPSSCDPPCNQRCSVGITLPAFLELAPQDTELYPGPPLPTCFGCSGSCDVGPGECTPDSAGFCVNVTTPSTVQVVAWSDNGQKWTNLSTPLDVEKVVLTRCQGDCSGYVPDCDCTNP